MLHKALFRLSKMDLCRRLIPTAKSVDRSFVIASEAKQSRQHRFARLLLDRHGGQGRLAMTRCGWRNGQDFWRLVLVQRTADSVNRGRAGPKSRLEATGT